MEESWMDWEAYEKDKQFKAELERSTGFIKTDKDQLSGVIDFSKHLLNPNEAEKAFKDSKGLTEREIMILKHRRA